MTDIDLGAFELSAIKRYAIGDVERRFRTEFIGSFPLAEAQALAPPPPPPPPSLRDTDVVRDVRAPGHTETIFDPVSFPSIVEWAVEIGKRRRFEAIAGSGHSGLILAGAAAYILRIPVIAVRKDDDRAKGDSNRVNAVLPHRPLRYAFVDDFIASGETIRRVYDEVSSAFPQARLTDCLFYRVQADRPDAPPDSYSYVESTRDSIARRFDRGFALSLTIHGYPRALE